MMSIQRCAESCRAESCKDTNGRTCQEKRLEPSPLFPSICLRLHSQTNSTLLCPVILCSFSRKNTGGRSEFQGSYSHDLKLFTHCTTSWRSSWTLRVSVERSKRQFGKVKKRPIWSWKRKNFEVKIWIFRLKLGSKTSPRVNTLLTLISDWDFKNIRFEISGFL